MFTMEGDTIFHLEFSEIKDVGAFLSKFTDLPSSCFQDRTERASQGVQPWKRVKFS